MGYDRHVDSEQLPELVDRNDEYTVLTDAFADQRNQCLYLYGQHGLGKTLVARHVVNTLSPQTAVCYLSCITQNTQYKILRTLHETLTGEALPPGLHTAQLYTAINQAPSRQDSLLVLNGIDFLLLNDGDTLLYALSRLDDERKPHLLLISGNHPDLATEIDERIYSSLLPTVIPFDPYTADETQRILTSHTTDLLNQPVTSDALSRIAATSSNISLGLHWLKTAADRTDGPITSDDIGRAEEDAIHRYRDALLAPFSDHHRLLLEVIETLTADLEPVHSGAVYEGYQNLCRRRGIDPFTTRRISDFLKHLALLNLIRVNQYTGGKQGKTREIWLRELS
jgi:Cdc6-like AAA superfamily ATPase